MVGGYVLHPLLAAVASAVPNAVTGPEFEGHSAAAVAFAVAVAAAAAAAAAAAVAAAGGGGGALGRQRIAVVIDILEGIDNGTSGGGGGGGGRRGSYDIGAFLCCGSRHTTGRLGHHGCFWLLLLALGLLNIDR